MIATLISAGIGLIGAIGRAVARKRQRKRSRQAARALEDYGEEVEADLAQVYRVGPYLLALVKDDATALEVNRRNGLAWPASWWLLWPASMTLQDALEQGAAWLYNWRARAWQSTATKDIDISIPNA